MALISEQDWQNAAALMVARQAVDPSANYMPYKVGVLWMVVCPDFEEEISGPFPTREACDRCIENLEQNRAEAHAERDFDAITPRERHIQEYTEKYR